MISDEEMYKGLTPEQIKANRKEVAQKWGEESLTDSEDRVRKMSPQKWEAVKAEGDNVTRKLAELMDEDPASPEVQKWIAAWYKYLHHFYQPSEQIFRGLGQAYVEDERFTAFYDKYKKGLAAFINKGIQIYCDRGMKLPD